MGLQSGHQMMGVNSEKTVPSTMPLGLPSVCAMELATSPSALRGRALYLHFTAKPFHEVTRVRLEILHGSSNEKNFFQFFPDFLVQLKINVTCAPDPKAGGKS